MDNIFYATLKNKNILRSIDKHFIEELHLSIKDIDVQIFVQLQSISRQKDHVKKGRYQFEGSRQIALCTLVPYSLKSRG